MESQAGVEVDSGGEPCAPRRPTGVEGFAAVARRLADATRAAGLRGPGVPLAAPGPGRGPHRCAATRAAPSSSVRLRDRPFDAVIADMVEGVIVTNRLGGEAALRVRTYLAEAVADLGPRHRARRDGVASGQARVVERQTRAA